MLHDAMDIDSGPTMIRWSRSAARHVEPSEVGAGLRARAVLRAPAGARDVCIVGVGKMLEAAEAAAEILRSDGVGVTVWDPRVIRPLDAEMIADAARHRFVITAEDGMREGGIGSAIADQVADLTAGSPTPRIRVLGTPVAFISHGNADALLAELGLDAAGIAASALALMGADQLTQ